MLKADLHIHTGEDHYHPEIKYSAKELIDSAAKLGFQVISITNHSRVTFSKPLSDYAAKRGIVLIPGTEQMVEGKDVLIYNISHRQSEKITTFDALEKLRKRRKDILVIAPHPFYIGSRHSLGRELLKNIELFDAIEYSHFYSKYRNTPNQKAARTAHEFNKPLVGTSDAHHLWRLNTTYTLIDSKKTVGDIISAVKKHKINIYSRHLSLFYYLRIVLWMAYSKIYRKLHRARQRFTTNPFFREKGV
jgi:predicted metal-dependent phosphoesterase TrpH